MVDVLFSFLCVLISIRCLGCSFKEIFRTLKDFLLLLKSLLSNSSLNDQNTKVKALQDRAES